MARGPARRTIPPRSPSTSAICSPAGPATAGGPPGTACCPPQAEAPDEDLLSLIFFYEANHDAVVESLPAPIGRTSFPPVIAHEYIGEKLDAIGVT